MGILIQPKRWSLQPPVGTQINWGHPLANGLANAYLMTELGGSVVRDFVNYKSYALSSGVTWQPPALKFDGSTNAHIFNVAVPDTSKSFFWVGWVRLDSSAATQEFIYITGNVTLRFVMPPKAQMISGSVPGNILHPTVLSLGNWYQVAGGVDAVNLKMAVCVNGLFTSASIDASAANTLGTIGSTASSGLPLTGAIAYVLCYSRYLSPNEIQWLYVEPYAFMQPSRLFPAKRVDFDEGYPFHYHR